MEAFCLEPESGNRIFDGYPFKSGSGDSFDLSLNIAAATPQSSFPMSADQGYQPNGGLKEEFEMSSVMNDGGDLVNRPPASMFTSMEMSVPMTSTVDTMTSSGYQPPHHPYYYCQTTDMYNSGHPGPPAPGPPGHYPLGPLPHHASFVQQMVPPHLRQQSPYQGQGHGLMGPPLSVSPGQVTTSPGRTGDEPGSDSSAMSQWMCNKRASPDPIQMDSVLKPAKKPKTSKKKKKRDPNEPQKPVSAYALFFRDTQAAIKGSNPNASFGEISKIVASMWDALDSENKNMYKKKTENAKKEYLKALAAYRANLISKSNAEDHQIQQQQQQQQQSAAPTHHSSAAAMYGGYPFSGATYNPGGFPGHYGAASAQSVMAKRSPLLSSLMAGDARTQELMPAHGLYQHQSPGELLGGAGAGGPPSSMMLGGGGGGYHRGGGAALPGGVPPSQQPPQSMMPPASQPLYMHHHGAVLTAPHHPQPPSMHHHSQQMLSDRAAMGSPLQQLSPSAQPLAPSPQQPSYHQMSPPRHSPPHPRHLSSQSPSSQMEPPAHSPCGVARSPGLVADWQHAADVGGASGHQHQRDVTGECLVGPCREVYKTWPAGVASGANPGGFVPSQSAPAAPAN